MQRPFIVLLFFVFLYHLQRGYFIHISHFSYLAMPVQLELNTCTNKNFPLLQLLLFHFFCKHRIARFFPSHTHAFFWQTFNLLEYKWNFQILIHRTIIHKFHVNKVITLPLGRQEKKNKNMYTRRSKYNTEKS